MSGDHTKNMYRIASVILALQFVIVTNAHSSKAIPDSIRLDDVIVTGTRTETNLRNLPMTISVVGNQQIENRFEPSLLPVITEEVPGLFVTSRGIMGYGVSTGAAGGMSIRGIGGSPTAGVLILIDGHPQYMGLMGHPLADSYQSMMAQRVEVVRGPASILYGSNAMGGVINIITKKSQQDGVQTGIRSMYGSYNTYSGEINNAVRSGKFNSYVSLDYNRSDGHRDNMDFKQYSGYAKLGYDLAENWTSFADLNFSYFSASNPGTKDVPAIDNDANITRGVTSFSLENKYERTSGALKFFYNFGHHKINDGYKPGGTPKNFRFKSDDDMFGVSVYQTYSFFANNKVTGGFDLQRFGGNAWNAMDNGDKNDIINKSLNDVAGYINIQQILFDRLTLNGGIRLDHNSHTGNQWIPQAGLSYMAGDNTTLKAIVSKGFRNPTIREMYMFPPQNPDLRPEKLMSYELSLSQNLLNNAMDAEISLYYIDGENLILPVSIVGEDGVPRPKNINTGKIENYGLEFTTRYRWNRNLTLSANYSWLHMKNHVPAAPEHKLYAGINYRKDKWSVSTGVQYVHGLYTSVEDKESTETFTLWNIRGSYTPLRGLEIFAKAENLLAQEYEINKGYPMPRATVFGGVNYKF